MKRYNNVLRLAMALGAAALMLWLTQSVMAAPPSDPLAQGGAPMYINYQGRLTDVSGNPLTGTHVITFTIYDQQTGGTNLWSDSYTVQVTDGAFSQLLGPLSDSVFDSPDHWLELEVDGETLSPRQRIASVAYAIQSQQAMTATNALGVRAIVSSTEAPVYADNQGSAGSHGVYGRTSYSPTTGSDVAGVRGEASLASGVYGSTDAPTSTLPLGTAGVVGDAQYVPGVRAQSTMQQGLWAYSANDAGVYATTGSGSSSPAVVGNNNETSSGSGPGVMGEASNNDGVVGVTYSSSGGRAGVAGESATGGTGGSPTAGVWGMGSNNPGGSMPGGDYGVVGITRGWVENDAGVYGEATDAVTRTYGVYGASAGTAFESAGVFGTHSVYTAETTAGVWGVSFQSGGCSPPSCPQVSGFDFGVLGFSEGQQHGDAGVFGNSYYTNTAGVWGKSQWGYGLYGGSSYNVGIRGESKNDNAIEGMTSADPAAGPPAVGVLGTSNYTYTVGVVGDGGTYGEGVQGLAYANSKTGVVGLGFNPGSGQGFASGVRGISYYSGTVGVGGISTYGYGVYAQSTYTYSLYVSGTARVTGILYAGNVITGDVAEMYYASGALEPGDVAVIDPTDYLALRRADAAYDSSVAGIVSTEPTMILAGVIDRSHGVPLALAGRVPCKVDASYGAIAVGDLLTTSPTPGHAMKVGDKVQAIGAIIGKALQPLDEGTGTIMVLVTLQ